eukprot:Clim_evm59s119 gene=Clim_evmTU59s119
MSASDFLAWCERAALVSCPDLYPLEGNLAIPAEGFGSVEFTILSILSFSGFLTCLTCLYRPIRKQGDPIGTGETAIFYSFAIIWLALDGVVYIRGLEEGEDSRSYLIAVHTAFTFALYASLLMNGFTQLQVIEDGTPLSLSLHVLLPLVPALFIALGYTEATTGNIGVFGLGEDNIIMTLIFVYWAPFCVIMNYAFNTYVIFTQLKRTGQPSIVGSTLVFIWAVGFAQMWIFKNELRDAVDQLDGVTIFRLAVVLYLYGYYSWWDSIAYEEGDDQVDQTGYSGFDPGYYNASDGPESNRGGFYA